MDLRAMEQMAASKEAGEAPPVETQSQVQADVPVIRASGMDVALINKTEAEQIHILKAAVSRGLDKDDPVLDIYNAATSAARSANSVATAALQVVDGLDSIPEVMQKAIIAGAGDVRGEVKQAFLANFDDLRKAIHVGIKGGATASISLIDGATAKLTTAAQGLDSEMNKAIIAKREAVLSDWVQSGSDALDKRIREAVRTERTVNLVFILFAIGAAFGVGIVFGMHLHF